MKEAYQDAYRQLAQCYLNKEDVGKYLSDYTIKEGAAYLPIDTKVRAFVEYYYAQYRLIGQQVWQ
jgi:hypothetical protein